VREIVHLCKHLTTKDTVPLRDLARILGHLTWAIKAVPFAQSHCRGLQMLYINECARFDNVLNTRVGLNGSSIDRSVRLSMEPPVAAFYEMEAQPESVAVDAFTQSWKDLKGYAFPPFNLIQRCLIKIGRDRAEVLMVTPVWPSQLCWPVILELACAPPRIMRPSNDLLLDATGSPHPLLVRRSLLLAV